MKKNKESRERLIQRYVENKGLKHKVRNIISVNTNKSYEEVIKYIKEKLWELL